MRNATFLIFMMLFTLMSQVTAESLKVDFTNTGGTVQEGYEGYFASHENASTFTTQSYSAFGTTVSITPSWAESIPQAMQLINRTNNPGGYEVSTLDLMREWIGTDTRDADDGGGIKALADPMTLTISGLPEGSYTWKSYHHDVDAQNLGEFDVTINDASGSVITYDVHKTGSTEAMMIDQVGTFETTIQSNGVDDITFIFDNHPIEWTWNDAWFVMNGFEISDGQTEDSWQSTVPLRRPISPEQPMWLVHIDTWNYPDPQKIIDLIPQDIRPYVVFNISLSINHDENNKWLRLGDGYETAKSWLRTCAENRMWTMIQQSSGGYSHFSDYDLSVYEDFYRNYPNFIGYNYAEQFWGFNDPPLAPSWEDRIEHFANLLKLSNRYGGYLVVSWCGNQWSPSINPMAMLKRIPSFEVASRSYPENFILCEKYTQQSYISDMESLCLGAYVSGYSGQYGIRYDDTGWTDVNGDHDNFTLSTGGAAHLEHIMLTGMTVIDAPELIWTQCFGGGGTTTLADGYRERRWYTFSQFDNVSVDLFRKIIDGTVRIPSRQEVINRTKVVVINDVNYGSNDDIYSTPETLFEGLYRMDGDGNYENNKTFFKKTGRYPTVPTVYQLADPNAQSFQVKVNRSAYSSRWPTIANKVSEFNNLFPSEYTGDIYAGRHENGWVVYNPYKSGAMASGTIPFKYNTCNSMELSLSQYTSGVIKEYADRVTFYLGNYDNDLGLGMRTDTIKIYGSISEPTYSWYDRANHQTSIVSKNWSGGVFTLTVQHNGALDITINCEGTATGRLTDYTEAVLATPAKPLIYTGARQYEAELFDHKNISGYVGNGATDPSGIENFTGQGYLRFGTSSSASVRDYVTVLEKSTYQLETRYSVTGGNVNTIDLYVNGSYVATPTFTQTATYSDWAVITQNITLNAGTNKIEFIANGSGSHSVYFDNMVIVPTAYYGGGIIIQENRVGFSGVDGLINTAYSGYTGDGYADTTDSAGAGIDWEIDFDTSITRSFTLFYACPDDRTADLIVNGQTIIAEIQFPSTGSWSNWNYVTVYGRAAAGVSSVRLQSTSALGLPNIDYIEVTGIYALEAPEVPTGLNAAASASPDEVDLSWNPSAGATSYYVKRSTSDGGPYATIANPAGNSYTDTGLSESITYYYVVSGLNSAGESSDSTQASETTPNCLAPAAPTGLNTIAANGSVTLDWNDNGESDFDSYNVYRSITSGSYGTPLATGVGQSSYVDNTALNNILYYYAVTAVDTAANESDYSDPADATVVDGSIILLSGLDFESGLGDWINITGEDVADWIRYSGGTLTPNTGPNSGAIGSTWYIYLETSPGGAYAAGQDAILESPVIRGYKRILSFNYHMYGVDIGTLNVDIYDGTWHNAVWSRSGQQHSSNADEYSEAIVNLSGFSGPILIRFRAVAAGGPRGDMAIDNIQVAGGLLYGDLNDDKIVNLGDLLGFTDYWLQNDCTLDIDGDCVITLYEFSEFARNWLDGSYQ